MIAMRVGLCRPCAAKPRHEYALFRRRSEGTCGETDTSGSALGDRFAARGDWLLVAGWCL